jgi:hypothetical protein
MVLATTSSSRVPSPSAATQPSRLRARVVGIILAVLSAIANFLFIPYYPVWSLLIIAVDVFIIWALAVHGREVVTG